MKTKIQGLLILGITLISLIAFAQEEQPKVEPEEQTPQTVFTQLPVLVTCGPRELLLKPVHEAEEILVAEMDSVFTVPGPNQLEAKGELWISPTNRTFTYVMNFNDVSSCFFTAGANFRPSTSGTPTHNDEAPMIIEPKEDSKYYYLTINHID